MGLSSDLISQFVKVTKDDTKTKKETITYGTITVDEKGTKYVQLDGSTILTPLSSVESAVDVDKDDRVKVMIKNHTVTITGNLSNPSATYIINDTSGVSENIRDVISKFDIAIADKVDAKELNAEKGRIDTLVSENVNIKDSLNARKAEITALQAKDVTITEQLTANQGYIDKLNAAVIDVEVADVKYANVTEALKATNAEVYNLESTYAEFEVTTTDRLTSAEADIESLNSNKVNVKDIEGKFANIDFSNIGQAAIQQFFSKSGMISDLTVGDGTITGKLVGVTISGDLIEGNTVKADKLVVKGSDGLYYKLNIEAGATTSETVSESDLQNGLHGTAIIAKTITAEKIRVNDLVAFGATIGGYKISENSLYSGAKSSADNTARGVYLDSTGQMSVGDGNNFLRYYLTSDGTYKLEISASSIILGASKKSVETAISDVQSSVDNLKIGGRNLAVGTTDEWVERTVTAWSATLSHSVNGVNSYLHNYSDYGVQVGDWLTFSIDLQAINKQIAMRVDRRSSDDSNGTAVYGNYIKVGETGRSFVSVQITEEYPMFKVYIGADGTVNSNTIEKYKCFKVEKGKVPTDWTLSPEDTEQIAASISNEIVDSISIGGRNLLLGSEFKTLDGWITTRPDNVSIDTENTIFGNNSVKIEASDLTDYAYSGIGQDVLERLKPGETYTFSIWVYKVGDTFDGSGEFRLYFKHADGTIWNNTNYPSTIESDKWVRIENTVTMPIDIDITAATFNINIVKNGTLYVSSPKVEMGTKATDWTRALEEMADSEDVVKAQSTADDAEAKASDAQSLIAQLKDSISMLVTDGNGTSLMTQTEEGWTFSTAEIQSSVNKISDDLNSLTSEVGDVGNTVGILEQAVSDLGEIAEYVKITTLDDEPCIELGEGDSEFKLRITNTRMMFTEGSTTLAYFNNQSFHVKKAVIEEELQQGGFIWKVRSNGNLGLVWKGAT